MELHLQGRYSLFRQIWTILDEFSLLVDNGGQGVVFIKKKQCKQKSQHSKKKTCEEASDERKFALFIVTLINAVVLFFETLYDLLSLFSSSF